MKQFKSKFIYKNFEFGEYQNSMYYLMKRSFKAMEVLINYKNYLFLIKKIPKLPFLIIEYFSQSLIEDDKL